jgi:hypothetical protein
MDKAKLHIAARARKNNEDIMFKPKAGWVIGYGPAAGYARDTS